MKKAKVLDEFSEVASRFPVILCRLRGTSGMTLKALEKRTGIHFTVLHALETGKRPPRWAQVVALAKVFKVSPGFFAREVQ